MLDKETRRELMARLIERWKLEAQSTRAAHLRDYAAGQITVEGAVGGACGNVLQTPVNDVEDLLRGIDPTHPRRGPLVSQHEKAYVCLHYAVKALFEVDALPNGLAKGSAAREARKELAYALKHTAEHAPIEVVERAMAGEADE